MEDTAVLNDNRFYTRVTFTKRGDNMKTLTTFLISLIITLTFTGCTITHEYGPYSGKVIDTETREPIEGAAVLVVFYTETWGLTVSQSKFIDAVEVLTDENGEFNIPGKRITGIRPLHSWNENGYVTIFKPGYGCYPRHKDVNPMFVPNGTIPENQRVMFELPKLVEKEELLENTDCFPMSVPDEKMTKLIGINNIERKRLGLQPTHTGE